MDTTSEMLAYLQQLRAKVADMEQQDGNSVSDSGEEDESQAMATGAPYTYPLRVVERSVNHTNGDSFKGLMLGDQRHGQGTHTTSTGDVYTGSWQYDKRHGQGTFRAASGMVYEGSWEDDKATGSGRCVYPDGGVYDGDWQADERSGWGTLTTADGQTYEGEWEANAPHGEGQWTFADGLSHFRGTYRAGKRVEGQLVMYDAVTKKPAHRYTGRFKDDQRHGLEGVGVEEGLWVYRGSWKHDSRWGQGHCRFTDGSVYEGEWMRDMRHGSGRMTLSDGTVYEGHWQDDKQHGTGKAKYASGEVYMGHWQRGKRHGQGKWSSAPKTAPAAPVPAAAAAASSQSSSSRKASKEVREVYVGSWVAGKREGHGVAEYADGGRYEGQWKADRRHGQGLMVFADGTVFRGAWEEDEWLQSAAEPALCRMSGPGLQGAVAGQKAEFVIQARDELSNPRLNGGDTFHVLLVPTPTSHNTSSSSVYREDDSSTHSPLLLTGPAAALQKPTAAAAGAQGIARAAVNRSGVPRMELQTYPEHSSNSGSSGGGGSYSSKDSLTRTSINIASKDGTACSASSSSSSGASVGMEAYCSPSSGISSDSDTITAIMATNSTTIVSDGSSSHGVYLGTEVHLTAAATATATAAPPAAAAAAAAAVGYHPPSGAGPTVEAVAAGDVQDNGNGTYSCSYMYTQSGAYELHVTNGDGEHIAGSPCRVTIPGAASARHSSITGPGRSTAVAGSNAEFTVTFKDAYGNPCCTEAADTPFETALEVRLIGSNTITAAEAEVTPLSHGAFSCNYVAPSQPGLYVLEVTADGRHVGGSPFSVRVSEALPQSLSVAAAARAAAASSAIADNASTTTSTHRPLAGTTAVQAPHSLGSANSHSSSGDDANAFNKDSVHNTAATPTAPAAATQPGVQDKLRWWGDVAKQAYAAIDGCLQGFEDAIEDKSPDVTSHMSPSEADMVKANPSLPVVERLEDLWLLSRLQQERKAQQQQQRTLPKQLPMPASTQAASAGSTKQPCGNQVPQSRPSIAQKPQFGGSSAPAHATAHEESAGPDTTRGVYSTEIQAAAAAGAASAAAGSVKLVDASKTAVTNCDSSSTAVGPESAAGTAETACGDVAGSAAVVVVGSGLYDLD